jgi:hypothetical protein
MVLIRQSSIWSNAISAEKFALLDYYNVLRELENSQPAKSERRLPRAAVAWIGDLTHPAAVRFQLLVRDDGQPAPRTTVHILRHWLRGLAVDADDPSAECIAAWRDRDDATAIRRRPGAERAARRPRRCQRLVFLRRSVVSASPPTSLLLFRRRLRIAVHVVCGSARPLCETMCRCCGSFCGYRAEYFVSPAVSPRHRRPPRLGRQ